MKTLEQLGISPAPWKHTPADEWTHAGIDDANGCGVGETYQVQRSDEGTETANARICAAAPELYEALRGLLEIVCIDCKSSYTVDGKCVKCPRVVAAEAALADASGESEVER